MVKIEEVANQEGAANTPEFQEKSKDLAPRVTELTTASDDDEDFVEEDDFDINESLLERVQALKDAIPPQIRDQVVASTETVSKWTRSIASFGGKSLWVITSSSLLLGIPLTLCILSEQQLTEMSKTMDTNVLS